ncbi:hypothetical protein FKM82_012557 [Ascaphus truei]
MPRCCLGVVVPRSRVLHCRTSSAHPPARLRFPECRARVAWRTAMTAEFDEEVVFENSPLYQYLQDLGHTDFEICPVVSQEEEECPAESGRPEQDVHATAKQGIYSRTADIWKRWSPFFSEKKKDEKVHLLDIGFRLDGLCTILQQEVLIQEDVELIELLDPGILSAGQTQKLQNGHLPTLRSIATPNIWDTSVLFAFVSASLALQSWHISSSLIWGLSLLLLAAYVALRARSTWRTATLQVTLRKYCGQLEGTVTTSRAFTNLVRKALRLIQETEVISRGFTLVIILEDELEKLACSKETQSVTTEASLVLEEKLKMIQPHVQASNTCWEEAMCQVERMVRKPPTKKDLANASCDNLHCPVAPCVPPALRIEDKDPIPEEQEFEAYVEDTAADHEFSKEEVYLFSPEERERQKREMEESKRVLQELKAVLGLKASEAERQKWKQLLFSDHAVMKPTQTEEPMDNFEPSPDTEDPDVCKTLDFHQEISRESNGTGHHPEEATSGESSDIPINANVEAETRTCCQLEEAGPASSEEELGPPRPAPRTVLPASIKERLARLHQSSDLNFASGLAAQVASRSLTFTFLQEQTFGDDWDIDEGQVDNGYNHGEEGGNEDTCSEHEE